jgi:hypothetical protein
MYGWRRGWERAPLLLLLCEGVMFLVLFCFSC